MKLIFGNRSERDDGWGSWLESRCVAWAFALGRREEWPQKLQSAAEREPRWLQGLS